MEAAPKTDYHGHPGRPGPPAAFAAALRLGAPQSHGSLTVVPLAFWRDRGPHYDTLAAALRAGTLHVTEISAGGSVPELKVINQGARAVLMLDGEELVGAKQNRVLNSAVLVREHSSLVAPVSCVEAGRWNYSGHEFHDEEVVVHARVRRAVHESVSMSLSAAGAHRSDQGRVWAEVAELQEFAEHASHTGAHRDVYAQRAGDIAGYLDAFPRQHGLLVLRDGAVVGLDFVSRAAAYVQLHDKLLRSYAFDAVTREMARGGDRPRRAAVGGWPVRSAGRTRARVAGPAGERARAWGCAPTPPSPGPPRSSRRSAGCRAAASSRRGAAATCATGATASRGRRLRCAAWWCTERSLRLRMRAAAASWSMRMRRRS